MLGLADLKRSKVYPEAQEELEGVDAVKKAIVSPVRSV